mgnify:CR=1 FL=1
MIAAVSAQGEAGIGQEAELADEGEAAGADPCVVPERLSAAFATAAASEDFRNFVTRDLVTPAYLNAADYQRVVDEERDIYARVVPKLPLESK